MSKFSPALIFYLIASILVILANILDYKELEFITKPIVIPAIYFYYTQVSKSKLNIPLLIVLCSCFIGDMIPLIDDDIDFLWILPFFFIAYVILIKLGIDDMILQKINPINIIIGLITLGILTFVLFTILDILDPETMELYLIFLFYGITLIALAIISMINFFTNGSEAELFFSIMALCLIISNVFYSFYQFIDPISTFFYINLTFQLASYYCITQYFILRDDKKGKKLLEV